MAHKFVTVIGAPLLTEVAMRFATVASHASLRFCPSNQVSWPIDSLCFASRGVSIDMAFDIFQPRVRSIGP